MSLVVAVWQAAGTPADVPANLSALARTATEARENGADVLITPEMFITGYELGGRLPDIADADFLTPARELAQDLGIALVLGGPDPTPEGIYNAAYFIDSSGEITGRYRKSHLFGELDRQQFVAGDRPFAMVTCRGVRIAVMICYDVEFPEFVRAAALAGAHLVAVPTAQMTPFSFIAEQVVRVRAWENQVYVAYANHHGKEATLTYVGRSSIVAPDATVLDAIVDGEGLVYATVDPAVVERAQAENPYLTDRIQRLYRDLM